MAYKSGLSHSLATFFSILVSALVTEYFKKFFPKFFEILSIIGLRLSMWIEKSTSFKISYEIFSILFIAIILAFLWGIVYHFARKRS